MTDVENQNDRYQKFTLKGFYRNGYQKYQLLNLYIPRQIGFHPFDFEIMTETDNLIL